MRVRVRRGGAGRGVAVNYSEGGWGGEKRGGATRTPRAAWRLRQTKIMGESAEGGRGRHHTRTVII